MWKQLVPSLNHVLAQSQWDYQLQSFIVPEYGRGVGLMSRTLTRADDASGGIVIDRIGRSI